MIVAVALPIEGDLRDGIVLLISLDRGLQGLAGWRGPIHASPSFACNLAAFSALFATH
jgi:hypothetical protein